MSQENLILSDDLDGEARNFAYSYSEPLLEATPDPSLWGWTFDRIYQDLGDRQQLQQLLADCRQNPPNRVIVQRLDDLGDSLEEVGDRLAQFAAMGVALIALDTPLGNTGEPLSHTDLLQVFKTLQQSQQSRRIRKGHARNRVRALPPPGSAPYGYRRGKDRYTIDRATAPVVKDFFDHFLLYGSLRGSVRYLQKKYNKKISVSTGKRWLTSPVYRGDLLYRDGEIVADTHAAILSQDEAAQVDRLLRRNRQLPPRTASAPRSLAGLIACATCGSRMTVTRVTARHKTQEYLYLRPIACPNQPKCRAIAYDRVLEQTVHRICEDLPRAVSGVPLPDMDRIKQGIQAQIAAQTNILDQLPVLLESGVLDAETAELRAYNLRTEISALQRQLAQLPPVNLKVIAQTISLPQFWFDLSEAERRFYFREFIRQIQLHRTDTDWEIQLEFVF